MFVFLNRVIADIIRSTFNKILKNVDVEQMSNNVGGNLCVRVCMCVCVWGVGGGGMYLNLNIE